MTYNADHLNRRTLTFPAVKPCVSISYSTLINSLISLSTAISCFNSCHTIFTSNTHNAKSALRLIRLLEVFLQEIKDAKFRGKSVISLLSDLHVALQELIFLLTDLTHRDARVWMLIRSRMAADRFVVVFGAMVGALEGLPAAIVDGCDEEVRETVELLTHQSKQVGFRVETGDIWGSSAVSSALGRFKRGVISDPSELRRIMDYLGINTWAECDDQVKFLEHENGLDEPGSEQAVSLLGLMVYCRCVLFDLIDSDNNVVDKNMKGKQSESCIVPGLKSDDLKCPISLEIMVDPVTISTGHTYDRSSILKWFKSGSSACPKIGQTLECLDLVPNVPVKHPINQYCLENGVSLPSLKAKGTIKNGVNYVGNLAAEGAIKMVADFLSIKLAMGTLMEKNKAAYEIRLVTKRSRFSRACFVESGVTPYLLNLILAKDPTTQENSMAALLNLSKYSESKSIIVNNGGLGLVIGVLKNGIKMEARQRAAAILFYLSSVEEYRRRLIGNNPDAIPLLVELIRAGDDQGMKNALVAIYGLLMLPSNHYRVLEGRLVPLLVTLLDSLESGDLIVDSLAVLSALAEKRDGAKSILRTRALTTIVKVLCSSTSDSSRFRGEHCVSLLLSLCINGGREVVKVLVKSTSLMGALYSFLIDGTSRASKKATSLISILHEYLERSSTPSMPHSLPRNNFIHVW